ncbi:MAG: S26 family signal peptidase [Nitriliruptoraceae bacterium]
MARRATLVPAAATVVGCYLGVLAVDRSRIRVRGPSMTPTLLDGDVLLTVPALPGLLRRGAVVVVADPADPEHLVVKRLTARDGDRVQVRGDDPDRSTDGRVWGWLPRSRIRRVALARWPDVRTPLRRIVPPPEPVPPLPEEVEGAPRAAGCGPTDVGG